MHHCSGFFLCVSGETHFPKMGETHFPNAETHFQNHKTHFRGIFTQVGLYLTYIRHTADHKNAHTKTQSLHSSSLSMRDETHFHSTSAKLISKMPKLISKTLKLISEIAETHFQKAETHFRGILVEWPWLDFAQKKACNLLHRIKKLFSKNLRLKSKPQLRLKENECRVFVRNWLGLNLGSREKG